MLGGTFVCRGSSRGLDDDRLGAATASGPFAAIFSASSGFAASAPVPGQPARQVEPSQRRSDEREEAMSVRTGQ